MLAQLSSIVVSCKELSRQHAISRRALTMSRIRQLDCVSTEAVVSPMQGATSVLELIISSSAASIRNSRPHLQALIAREHTVLISEQFVDQDPVEDIRTP